MADRLPWEIVETLPRTTAELVEHWDGALAEAADDVARARALVGGALARYWSVQAGVLAHSGDESLADRRARCDEAVAIARRDDRPELLAEALLGRLYACWGPDDRAARDPIVDELADLALRVEDEELRLRIREWVVVGHFDRGDLRAVRTDLEAFRAAAAGTPLVLFQRREELWRGNLAMLEGRLDEAVRINQDAISTTADTAGSPFSFQNVAITLAIERYLRRGLADLVDAVRSIRASSPRVATNWDTGLAFTLSEIGELDEAATLFATIAADDFAGIHRDLNWLVTMHLLGLTALRLDDRPRMAQLLRHLLPFAHLDSTHGSGYASYGPVARVVGSMTARLDPDDGGRAWFDLVLRTRDPGPWTSLTRLDSAVARHVREPALALADAERAAQELRVFGMDRWAEDADRLRVALLVDGHGGPVAVARSGTWELHHGEGSAELADGVGVHHLLTLLARPGETIETADLDGVDPDLPRHAADAGTIDARTRRAYRDRLRELESRSEYRGDQPPDDAEATEMSFLRRELAAARFTPTGSAELERVRVRVTKALTRTIRTVSEQSPGLGAHLADAVETGRRCLYAPADGQAWEIVPDR